MKKLLLIILISLLMLSGCSFLFDAPQNPLLDYDFSEMDLVQLKAPLENQPTVKIYTSLGELTAMLFPEYAPNTVGNFLARVDDGFYENKPIFAVKEMEFLLTGALDTEGTQGVTQDGQLIPNEYSVDLWPFKGALLAYSGTRGFGDSRFFIAGSVPFTEEFEEEMRSAVDSDGNKLIPDELIEAFRENESVVHFSLTYTIFGQITDGFDTLDKLLSVPTSDAGENFRPIDEIYITKIEVLK